MDSAVALLFNVVFGLICAVIASGRGRSGVAWFFIGFLFPCIGLIVILAIPDLRLEEERRARLTGENRRLREQLRKDRMVADARHADAERRLQAHDRALGVDTAPARPDLLENPQSQPQWQVSGPAASTDPTAKPFVHPADSTGATPGKPEGVAEHSQRAWYFADHSGRQGPVNLTVLRTLWAQGTVTLQTYVWAEGMADWAPVSQVAGLQDALNAA